MLAAAPAAPRGDVTDIPANEAEARRFLSLASFGPDDAQLARLMRLGDSAWLDERFSLPQRSHRQYWDDLLPVLQLADPEDDPGTKGVLE